MNKHRMVVGLIFLFLLTTCLIQATTVGCSKSSNPDVNGLPAAADNNSPFFHSSGVYGDGGPVNWVPVSDNVQEQIRDTYAECGLFINNMQRGEGSPSSIRCSLELRDGVSLTKQYLDGLFILYNTFPEQRFYVVELDGSENEVIETDWETLVEFMEIGYSPESSTIDAQIYWNRFFSNTGQGGDSRRDRMVDVRAKMSDR